MCGGIIKKHEIKAVLFDLDNTLIDFMRMKRESCAAAIEAMIGAGLKMDREEAMRILFELYDEHGIEYQLIFQDFLQRVLGRIDYRLVAEGIVAYRRVQLTRLTPYSNVVSTLVKLKERGLRLGIVSDAPARNAWMRLVEMRLTEFFDVVVTLDDTQELKPSPMPFRKALDALQIPPENVLFVGDRPERDIEGAKKLGMKTVFARYGYQTKHRETMRPIPEKRQSGADYEIEDIGELVKIVG